MMEQLGRLEKFELKRRVPLVIDDLVIIRRNQSIGNYEYRLPGRRYFFPNDSECQPRGKETVFFVYADQGTDSWRILRDELVDKGCIHIFRKELSRLLEKEGYTTIPEGVNAIDITNPFGSFIFCIGLYRLPQQHYLLESSRKNLT